MDILFYRKRFADRLKELMQAKGIKSIKSLSEFTGIPQKTISNWLHLKRGHNLDYLCILSKKFGVKVDYLLGLSD